MGGRASVGIYTSYSLRPIRPVAVGRGYSSDIFGLSRTFARTFSGPSIADLQWGIVMVELCHGQFCF